MAEWPVGTGKPCLQPGHQIAPDEEHEEERNGDSAQHSKTSLKKRFLKNQKLKNFL